MQSRDSISPTLGSSQLASGLLAGLIGLILVVAYSFFQYRALAAVTIASIVVAAVITYLVITILSWREGYRLSLAGVAGLIVAIGFTVDSFIVYFERIRDELRDGRGLVGAVEAGWKRALRTIYAAKGVNLLSAVVLRVPSLSEASRDSRSRSESRSSSTCSIVVLFTHPMMQLIATTRFFSSGHPLSGLDPNALGAVYRGRAEFRVSTEARRRGANREAGRRQTIAERKAAEAAAADAAAMKAEREASDGGGRQLVAGPKSSEIEEVEEGEALMASGMTKFGNDLYTGERSVPFIRLRRIWLTIAVLSCWPRSRCRSCAAAATSAPGSTSASSSAVARSSRSPTQRRSIRRSQRTPSTRSSTMPSSA